MRIAFGFRSKAIGGGPSTAFTRLVNKIEEMNSFETERFYFQQRPLEVLVEVKRFNPDLAHFHNAVGDLAVYSKICKTVVSYHGILNWSCPQLFLKTSPAHFLSLLKSRFENLLCSRFADMLLSVSNYEKRIIKRNFNIANEKVKTVYNGIPEYFRPKEELGQYLSKEFTRRGIEKNRYILHVSNQSPRKNFETLLKAWKQLSTNLDLVVPGDSESNEFKSIGRVPEAEMPSLYSNALMLVNPSLYEGFGLPFAEAMACGCPVIGSNNSAMPEIIGNAGVLLENPKDEDKLAMEIKNLVNNLSKRKKLSKKGLNRSKCFALDRCAKRTTSIYEQLLGETG